MSKNTQNKYTTSLKKIAHNQSETFDREYRNEIVSEINRLNAERNAYEFQYSTSKGGLKVTRVVPSSFSDRQLYIESINKNQLTSALRSNNWSKEAAAREFGISARSIGRMIQRRSVVSQPYSPATKSVTKSKATTKSTSKAR